MAVEALEAGALDKQLFGKPQAEAPRSGFRRTERACAATLLLGALFAAGTTCLLRRSGATPRSSPLPASATEEVARAFEAWSSEHGRQYATPEDRVVRLAIFRANFRRVQAENGKGHPYRLALNEFADRTSQEFRASHFGLTAVPRSGELWRGLPRLGTDRSNGTNHSDLPSAWDWVGKGAVTPPKNQGQCGSCWAFSATGALEGAWQIARGSLVSLSEQQLVDCSKDNNACGGGDMDSAFAFAQGHDVCTESGYPYTASAGSCQAKCQVGIPRGSVAGYRDVAMGDERALMEAVLKQPVSVAIQANQLAFQLYGGGVLTKTCGDKVDHGVLLVGFGSEGGLDYWKVKNSWGAAWGEGGYIRIQRGASGPGECGIQSMSSYPIIKNATLPSSTGLAAPPLPESSAVRHSPIGGEAVAL